MIIRVSICRYGDDTQLISEEEKEISVDSSWYTAQNYFNENLKSELLDDESATWAIVLKWRNKNYLFKRKKNGDTRHQEGRKKRAPRPRKAA